MPLSSLSRGYFLILLQMCFNQLFVKEFEGNVSGFQMGLDPPIEARLIQFQPTLSNEDIMNGEFELTGCINKSYSVKFKHTFPKVGTFQVAVNATNSLGYKIYKFQHPVITLPSGLTIEPPAVIAYGMNATVPFRIATGSDLTLEASFNGVLVPVSYNATGLAGEVKIPPTAHTTSGEFNLRIIYDNPLANQQQAEVTIWVQKTLVGLQSLPAKAAWNRSMLYSLDVIIGSGEPVDISIDWNDSSSNSLYLFNLSQPNTTVLA